MNKKIVKSVVSATIGIFAACAYQMATAADSKPFSLSTGFDYSSGKYGGSTSTDILYIPVIAKYDTGAWSLKLTVPYISITGPGNVIKDIGAIRTVGGTTHTTESGLGDVVAAATFNVFSGGPSDPIVDLTGKVKFGTADSNKGLGTGKNDYAAQVDIYKGIDRFTVFGSAGYKVLGSPTGITLNNVFYGSLGGGYKLNELTSAGLIMDLREKASATGSEQRELTAYLTHKYSNTWKAQGYVVKGFANGSPDWEMGGLATYSF